MLQNLFQNVIEVTLATSVVIAVLLIFHPLIRKNYTAKWRYWVWAVLAIRLLIPFSPSLANIYIEITPPSQNIEFKMPLRNAEDFQLPSLLAAPLSDIPDPFQFAEDSSIEHIIPKPRTITLNEILSIIWALGIAVFMFYHLVGYFLFKRLIFRFSRFVENKRVAELWSEVKDEMSIGTNIPLFTCKKVQGPMMTGFFKPILLLPDLDYNNTDLKIILKHELIHYKRKDIWYKLLLVCANAVHWFNPIIYLMVAKANKDVEIVCDSEVTKDSNTDYRKKYSETILSAIYKENLRKTAFSTYFYGGKRTMKERFSNIFDMRKKRKGMVAFLIVLISITLIGGIVACSTKSIAESAGNETCKTPEALDFYIMTDQVGAIGCEYGVAKSAGAMTKEEMFEKLEKIQGFIFDKFTTEELYVEFHFLKEEPRSITFSCIANGEDEYPLEYSGYRIRVPTEIGEYAIFAKLVYENGEQDTVFFSITVVQEHKTVLADTTPMKLSNDLEQSISQAILNYYAKDSYRNWYETVGEGHITLEVEEKQGLTYAYILELYIGFGFENEILTGISGHSNPATIVFAKDSNGNYMMKEFIRPLDGSEYLPSIKKMFSESAFKKYQSADDRKNRAVIEAQVKAYGNAYLEKIGRDADVQITLKDKKLIKINTDVSNYLFDAYGEYPYWIGTREVVEDGIRYVYEKSWLDKGNQNGIVTFKKSIYEGDIIEKTVIEIVGDKMNCLEGKLREEHHSKYNY